MKKFIACLALIFYIFGICTTIASAQNQDGPAELSRAILDVDYESQNKGENFNISTCVEVKGDC